MALALHAEAASRVPPLIGGGEMGQLVRDRDWRATPLGAYATWPQSLRSALSLVLNSRGIAALYWGAEQWLLYNDAYGAALGDRHPAAFGRPMPEVLTDIGPVLGPQVAQVLRSGQGFAIEDVLLTMQRAGRDPASWWTYSFSPVQGEDEGFAGVLLLATETTDQKAREREVRRESLRVEVALRAARLGAYDWDTTHGTVLLDARAREIFGLRDVGLVNEADVFGRIVPEDLAQTQAKAERAAGRFDQEERLALGENLDIAYDIVLPDGTRRSIASFGSIIVDETGSAHMVGAFNDVTDLKQARALLVGQNEVLAESVAILSAERDQLWQLSRDAFLICDLQGRWVSVSPAWTGILGWSSDELIGRTSAWMEHPSDHDKTRQTVLDVAAGEVLLSFTNRLRGKDGAYRTFSWTAVAEDNRLFCVARDITEQQRREEALIEAEDQLRQSQKMEAVGQLTGGIAHDFNNLLQGITGGLELLANRVASGRYDKVDRYINMAQTGANRAAALTQRLLAFSRRQTLAPTATDANQLIAGMKDIIGRTLGPEIEVKVVSTAGLWPILVDASQLENGLLNLCINARDAMPEGGRLTIEAGNKALDARAAAARDLPEGDYVSVCVSDTGIGMSPEIIERVFDPFFTTKPTGEGTGLGLSMVYGFVRQSGGQVRVYSEVGQGTTMCLYLPRLVGVHDLHEAGELPARGRPAEQGQTVLLVEDEVAIRELVSEVLGEAGYRVLTASNGPLGVALLQSNERIDLLVTDVGLPGGLNGRQVADAGRVVRPDLKVLFVTGYAANAAVGAGHLDEGMAVLTKPFNVLELQRRVREIISG